MNSTGRARQVDRDEEPPTNALERRRWQNRVSQRNYRRKVKDKIAQLEDRLLENSSKETEQRAASPYSSVNMPDLHLDLQTPAQFEVELDQHQLCPTCNGSGNISIPIHHPTQSLLSPRARTLSTAGSAPSLSLSDNPSTPDPDVFDNFESFFPAPSAPLYSTIPPSSVSASIEAPSPLNLTSTSLQHMNSTADAVIQSLSADADPQSGRPAIYLINPNKNTDPGSVYLIRLP